MLFELAVRNVKRQLGSYVIYFITVSLTVALMFAVNNVIFSDTVLSKTASIEGMRSALIALSLAIALVVAFILGYASSFMLRLRKREFGTYLTLGMTRGNVLCIFLIESLILCAVSLASGLLLGLAAYQGIMAIVSDIVGVKFALSPYSLQGTLFTLISVLAIFALSFLASAFYLSRARIDALIKAAEKTDKAARFPRLWFALAAVSLAAAATSCAVIWNTLIGALKARPVSQSLLTATVFVLAAAVVLFHIGLANGLFPLLLRSKRLKNRGAAVFTLRSLSSKMRADSVMTGFLALLVSLAVIGANFSFAMQSFETDSLERDYPFDVAAVTDRDNPYAIPKAEALEIISEFAEIETLYEYSVYTSDEHTLTGLINGSDTGACDLFMSLSEFNRLSELRGKSKLDLNGGFAVAMSPTAAGTADLSEVALSLGGSALSFAGFVDPPISLVSDFFAVVPDGVAADMRVISDGYVCKLKGDDFDAIALRDALTYSLDMGDFSVLICDVSLRAYAELKLNSDSAVYTVAALYVAFVFIFLAMAILALKTLTGLEENRRRFEILRQLGADRRELCRSLFLSSFVFFFFPFAFPLLLDLPVGIVCSQIMALSGLSPVKTIAAAVLIALCLAVVYALYFTATHLLAKRAILNYNR